MRELPQFSEKASPVVVLHLQGKWYPKQIHSIPIILKVRLLVNNLIAIYSLTIMIVVNRKKRTKRCEACRKKQFYAKVYYSFSYQSLSLEYYQCFFLAFMLYFQFKSQQSVSAAFFLRRFEARDTGSSS